MKIRAHKLGSVVGRLNLDPEVEISRKVDSVSGQVVVVRALEEKRVYDQLELTTGRMAHVGKGDVIVGALGRRDALRGFQGIVPAQARAGDTLHLLNLGGVIGQAVSENRDFGHPLRCEVLGMAVRNGKGVNIADAALPTADHIAPEDCPPLIVVSGTCMNAGKTVACCEIIAKLTARGYACAGLKMTGVACQKDLLNMEDHGALATLSFLDCGYPSTAGVTDVAPVAKGLLKAIAGETKEDLDVVVVEMGDGVIGAYGVRSVLEDPEIRALFRAHVLCANDLVAAWGGVQWLKAIGLGVDVVAGPATDNDVGIRYVSTDLGIPAANARVEPDRFADLVEQKAFGTSA
ncbi:MAG: hypothetical protein IT460_01030 [Planctomycetes bacterium]|nr:hypothetical protein [Planctomycetota bacterium]